MAKTTWTFTTGFGIGDDQFYLAAAADVYDVFERFTSLYTWSPELARIEGSDEPWTYKNVNWRSSSVSGYFPTSTDDWWLVALSEEGNVLFTGDGYNEEKIPGAGVYSQDAKGWGYLADVQQIGEHLYACGYKGQVYKRLGAGDWRHVDAGLLQDPKTPQEQRIALSVINGPHENAIYAAGYQHAEWLPPKAFFFNGQQWFELKLPEVAERIVNMYVESDERIWMCGSNGTLLLGNARDGFKSLSTVDDNQLFSSICKFQDKMYLASNLGLFVYDPKDHKAGIQKVTTDLAPDLQDANVVDSYDKVLWSIGPKDIARFDGKKWERIHHPDNPRIGEE